MSSIGEYLYSRTLVYKSIDNSYVNLLDTADTGYGTVGTTGTYLPLGSSQYILNIFCHGSSQ